MADKDLDLGTGNDALLKRIRERYRYGMEKWRKNREEGQKNIRYISGDPWDDEDKLARKGRPTVCADELNQYVNQVCNTARQNPRAIMPLTSWQSTARTASGRLNMAAMRAGSISAAYKAR